MIRALAVAGITALAIVGCSLDRPHPDQSFYVLEAAPRDDASAPAADGRVIRVPRAHVTPPFGARALQYRVAESRYESNYYHRWAGDPGALVAATARETLAGTGALVVAPGTETPRGATLELSVTSLAVDVTGPRPAAVVALRAKLLDADGTVLLARDLEHAEPATSAGAPDAVRAMNVALRTLLDDLAADVAEAVAIAPARN